MAYFKVLFLNLGLMYGGELSVRLAGNSAEIRTVFLRGESVQFDRYTNLFVFFVFSLQFVTMENMVFAPETSIKLQTLIL